MVVGVGRRLWLTTVVKTSDVFWIERQVHDGYLHIPSYPSRRTEFQQPLLSIYNGSILGMGPAGTIPVGLICLWDQ